MFSGCELFDGVGSAPTEGPDPTETPTVPWNEVTEGQLLERPQVNENGVVELDEERKAAMVSNLLVVLCGNKDAQPIVNSGSLY